MANTVWGLDIGNSAIKAVKMVKLGTEECKIVEFDIVDIPVAEDDKDRPSRVQVAMTTIAKNHKFGNDPVFISVAGNVCLHREFQLPAGSEGKLADLVQYEAKQQIPFPLEQVEWGFERYEDPNGVGVALIAVRKTDIQELINLSKSLGLNVKGITASPLSLFNFVHYEFRPDNTALILDAGAKGTDFVVMNKRQVYFRTIQIAGREITRVLENKFKVTYEKAEDLKKNIAKSPQSAKILTVIEPTLRQLGAEIQRTIGFYKSRARGQRIGQCFLLGHTFRLPKMAETLQAQVREAPFALVEGLQRVKLDHTIDSDVWNNEFPTMAVAIGLGLQGLGLSELKLNLIPQDEVKAQQREGWKAWAAAAAVVLLGTLYFSYTQQQAKLISYSEQLTKLNEAEQSAKKNEDALRAAVAGIDDIQLKADRYSRVGHDRGKVASAFSKLVALKGPDGKPFFGPENKAFLTNVYVSRIPPGGTGSGALPDSPERARITQNETLVGNKSIYAALGGDIVDPNSLPAEMRPDVPMAVIMSGEIENNPAARQVLSKLKESLEKMPECKEVRIEPVENGPTYTEPVIELNWDGTLKTGDKSGGPTSTPTEAQKEKKTQYMLFHAIMRWNDPEDPDREPMKAAPVAPPAKGGTAKKPAH